RGGPCPGVRSAVRSGAWPRRTKKPSLAPCTSVSRISLRRSRRGPARGPCPAGLPRPQQESGAANRPPVQAGFRLLSGDGPSRVEGTGRPITVGHRGVADGWGPKGLLDPRGVGPFWPSRGPLVRREPAMSGSGSVTALVESLKDGDHEAARLLWQRYYPPLPPL